jgi:PilZ domain
MQSANHFPAAESVEMMLPRRRENRTSLRRFMRRSAQAVMRADQPSVRCVILDMSDGGARLAFDQPLVDIPRSITLLLFKDGSAQRDCEVVWADRRYVGVKFRSEWYPTVKI